ncbi:MAG TPA: WbqC family protein [Pseudomonadales bacterium]|nr:WbqC family protein [Pseudomonadales bacterium]
MQPYFFPYLGYFQTISAVDKYIVYENLDYITGGWMHRNRILIKNQKPVYINAQIIGKSSNKKINEIELVKNGLWKKS